MNSFKQRYRICNCVSQFWIFSTNFSKGFFLYYYLTFQKFWKFPIDHKNCQFRCCSFWDKNEMRKYLHLFNRLNFFRVVLDSWQSRREGAESPHTYPVPTHTLLPAINIRRQSGTFVIVTKPTLTRHYHGKTTCALGFILVQYILWVKRTCYYTYLSL